MQVNILGIRGIPAAHGGFETFAAKLAPYLRDKGHEVLVYCQDDDGTPGPAREDEWEGIKRVHFTPKRAGALGTMEFDYACVRDVMDRPGVDLVLGYNTAIFNLAQRLKKRRIVMNMDGIEWKRAKWGLVAKTWFFLNEVAGANLCHTPVADHPEIAKHVAARCSKEPVMIPYGGDLISDAPTAPIEAMGLRSDGYFVSIARIEPENSILEMVRAYSAQPRGRKLVVLGKLDPANAYHEEVRKAGGDEVDFVGAIYDQSIVQALRFHARAYFHGHQVGGTNPSLVEALGAGNAVIAHDNRFNRWTAGDEQLYFGNEASCAGVIAQACSDDAWQTRAKAAARLRHKQQFLWDDVLADYEKVLLEA